MSQPMFASDLSIVDLETSGTAPAGAHITEVAVLRVRAGELVSEWSTLVNPGVTIPPAIQWLTGITDEMVAGAPAFDEVAPVIAEKLADSVLVAHNARFDYGFLKAEFARCGIAFSAKTLCTVRLSRTLYPGYDRHSLDALIARHGLPQDGRHRALGDARTVWRFLQKLRSEFSEDALEAALARLLKRPSLPARLAADVLSRIPPSPGVYVFRDANRHPLYIGKSINLRERVGSHFSGDHRSTRDLHMSREIADIEWIETVGELGALLREAALVKQLLPAHNVRLRRRAEATTLRIEPGNGRALYPKLGEIALEDLAGCFGVFGSRDHARNALAELAAEHRLCFRLLGLERGAGACFRHQLRRCSGACVGIEPIGHHVARTLEALAPLGFEPWPFDGAIALRERGVAGEDLHVFDRWCHLGTAVTLADAFALASGTLRRFDADAYRIASTWLRKSRNPDLISLPNA